MWTVTAAVLCLIILAILGHLRITTLVMRCDEQDRLIAALGKTVDWGKRRTDALDYRTRGHRERCSLESGGTS